MTDLPPLRDRAVREAMASLPNLSDAAAAAQLADHLAVPESAARFLQLAATLARVPTTAPEVRPARTTVHSLAAVLAAAIREALPTIEGQTTPTSLASFLQSLATQLPEVREALRVGAELSAPRVRSRRWPSPPRDVIPPPSEITEACDGFEIDTAEIIRPSHPTVAPTPARPPTPLPCVTCQHAPRRPGQRTCRACHAADMRARRQKRTRARAAQASPLTTRAQGGCEWCGEPFAPERDGQRYCGPVCGGTAATAAWDAFRRQREEKH